MSIKTKSLVILFGLCIFDVLIPIPMVCLFLIYVVLEKPDWFLDALHKIYET